MKRQYLWILVAALLLAAGCSKICRRTPPPPKPLAPANGSRVSTATPTLQVGERKDVDQYRWTIENAADSIIGNGTSIGSSWTVPKGLLVNSQKYEWTCAAHNTHGWGKDFDPEWSFVTDVSKPGPAVPLAPPANSEVPTLTPSLEVQMVSDADEYQWLVKDTTGKQVANGSTTDASWTVPDGALADKQAFTWTAQVRNAAGLGPAFAPEWSFRVRVPPPLTQVRGSLLKTIHFDFDRYDIRPGDGLILEDNASYLRANSSVALTLEGYCDPIGTEEYNRGLGLRRANSARAYLVKLGIDAARLSTISYGKERLVSADSLQYELDRRVEFVQR